ncbi:MAG: glycosyltransferase family 2 protein [Fusobacteriaceae bacterium]
MIDISVIMATYNRSKTIQKAIDSVLSQTFKNFELIIIDDGSTDNTMEVIQNISDSRIVYYSKENGGQSSARNYGIKRAKGKYIMFLDDDDEFINTALEKSFQKIEETGLSWIYCTQYLSIREKEEVLVNRGSGIKGDVYKYLLGGNFLGTGEIFGKDVFEKIGYFDEKLRIYEDKEVRIRIAKEGYKIDYIEGYIYKYYENESSVSSAYKDKNKRKVRFYDAQKKMYDLHKDYIEKDKELYEYWMKLMRRINTEVKNYESSIKFSKECLKIKKSSRNYRKYVYSLVMGTIFKDTKSLLK